MADLVPKPRKILVALDDSKHSSFALSWTLETLIPHSPDAPSAIILLLLHVQPHPEVVIGPYGPGFYITPEILDAVKKNQEEISKELLRRAKVACDERQLATETLVVVGDPREAICETAEKLHVDLLVVGSHGYGALKRAFLGSVSDYCAHNAKCPVVIVKKPTISHE